MDGGKLSKIQYCHKGLNLSMSIQYYSVILCFNMLQMFKAPYHAVLLIDNALTIIYYC